MDRSGYARGTLSPRPGLAAPVPALDSRPLLSMVDMGMAMTTKAAPDMDMPGMSDMPAMAAPSARSATGEQRGLERAEVDMIVTQPRIGLDDPGVGLRANGRRVLSYGELHTVGGPLDAREPSREVELHLTGHMQRYLWSFDGRKFSEASPLPLRYGERLRIVLINDTMMTHPIHLHGMWSELEDGQQRFQVRKHTVVVQPAQRLSYRVSANALGRWAYHCHLLYHMQAGMFREVRVGREAADAEHGS
jgi:CopA family copper-resistance protein